VTTPSPIEERGLVDNVHSLSHGPLGGSRSPSESFLRRCFVAVWVDDDNVLRGALKLCKKSRFVFKPTTPNDFQLWVCPGWPNDQTP
jgi:hypothetical protein